MRFAQPLKSGRIAALFLLLSLLSSCGQPSPPSFTLTLSPDQVSVPLGGSADLELTITPRNGFGGSVVLQLLNERGEQVPGISLQTQIATQSIRVQENTPSSQRLRLRVGQEAASGIHSLTLRGVSGSLQHEARLTLVVEGQASASRETLPPPVSGQGFAQPLLQVGSPAQGALLLEQDRLKRVVITPNRALLEPGEERLLAVWVETWSGERYAADGSYLELKAVGAGYEVAWAGPGRVRVRAPAGWTETPLYVNVRPREMREGRTFLNAVAVFSMLRPAAGVLVVPEELVAYPVGYELGQATQLARLAVFTLEEIRQAVDLDGRDGRVTVPAVVREDPGRGISAESLPGRMLLGEGEAYPLMGQVHRVVAQRGSVLLLAVEPLPAGAVFAPVEVEVDLDELLRQGVLPLEVGDALEEPEDLIQLQGQRTRPIECEKAEMKFGAKGEGSSSDGLDLSASLEAKRKCKLLSVVKFKLSSNLTFKLGKMKLGFENGRLNHTSTVTLSTEIDLKKELVSAERENRGNLVQPEDLWLFLLIYFDIPTPFPSVTLSPELGLGKFNLLSAFDLKDGSYKPKQEIELFTVGAKIKGSLGFKVDTSKSDWFSPVVSLSLSPYIKTFGGELSPEIERDYFKGVQYKLKLETDALGLGAAIKLGKLPGLETIAKLLQIKLPSGGTPLALVGAYFPTPATHEFVYTTRWRAIQDSKAYGKYAITSRDKAKVALRGFVIDLLLSGTEGWWSKLLGLKTGTSFELSGTIDLGLLINLNSVEAAIKKSKKVDTQLVSESEKRVRVEWTKPQAYARELLVYRESDPDRPIHRMTVGEGDTAAEFNLRIPPECSREDVSEEERTAVVIASAHWEGVRIVGFQLGKGLPFGYAHLGEFDLCKPKATLSATPIRSLVGFVDRSSVRVVIPEDPSVVVRDGRPDVELEDPGDGQKLQIVSLQFSKADKEWRAQGTLRYLCNEEGSQVRKLNLRFRDQPGLLASEEVPIVCLPRANPDPDPDPNPNPDPDTTIPVRVFCDPHLITPDGAAYDFHAQGEFWAIEHPQMPLQLRFMGMPGNPEATYTEAAAVRLGAQGSRVEVKAEFMGILGTAVPALRVLVEGVDRTDELAQGIKLALPGGAYLVANRRAILRTQERTDVTRIVPVEVSIIYPGAEELRPAVVIRADRLGELPMLGVAAVRPRSLQGQLRGLMGNANDDPQDDFVTREGVRLEQPLGFGTLYQVFGRSWEVRPSERFFTDLRPQVRYPQAPPALDPERVSQAEAFCGTISNPFLRQACILDGVVSGDYQRAAQYARGAEQSVGGEVREATQRAALGVSPGVLRLTAGAEASLTVANPGSGGRSGTYRLRLLGEEGRPGLVVDGQPLLPGAVGQPHALNAASSRVHRVRSAGCAGEDQTYLLQLLEEGATDAQTVLVQVACQRAPGISIELSQDSYTVPQGGAVDVDITFRLSGGLSGSAVLELVGADGYPVSGIALRPSSVELTGEEVTRQIALVADRNAPLGTYTLRLRAGLGEARAEKNLSLTVTPRPPHRDVRWNTLFSPLNDIAYAPDKNLWVAVGYKGYVVTSRDRASWSRQDSGQSKADLHEVIYGGGRFVALGRLDGLLTILVSSDGENWQRARVDVDLQNGRLDYLGGSLAASRLAYGAGRFIALVSKHTSWWETGQLLVITSTDGMNWSQMSAPFSGLPYYVEPQIAYGNGRFVVALDSSTLSSSSVYVSEDGVSWAPVSNTSGWRPWHLYYSDGQFLMVRSAGFTEEALTSSDGVNWMGRSVRNLSWHASRGKLFLVNGRLVWAGVGVTTDYSTWSPASPGWLGDRSRTLLHRARHLDGWLVAVGLHGYIAASRDSDGLAWEVWDSSPFADRASHGVSNLAFGETVLGPRFVVTTRDGRVYTSSDAREWTRQAQTVRCQERRLVFGNDRFVCLGDGGNVFVSSDGQNWVEHRVGRLAGLGFVHGRFLSVSERSVMASEDGISWGQISTLPVFVDHPYFHPAGDNRIVIDDGSSSRRLLSTDNGQSWQDAYYDRDLVYPVLRGQGLYAGIRGRTLVTSDDGAGWTEADTFGWGVAGLAYGSGTFVALGGSGDGGRTLVFTSRDGLSWYDNFPRGMVVSGGYQLLYGAGRFLLLGGVWEPREVLILGTP